MFERVTHGAVDVIQGDLPLNVENVEGLARPAPAIALQRSAVRRRGLENVPLIDSAGLELLLQFQEEFQQLGGALEAGGAEPAVR